MKKIFFLILSLILFIPNVVMAETQTLDLMDTLEKAGITPSIDDYEETEDQVQIYLFWSSTCTHCHDVLEFINDNLDEYGEKIKMRSYETSTNADNYALQQKVAKFFSINAPGVPLLVVGESTFYGFSDSIKDKILEAIDGEYSANEKYDVFEKIEEKEAEKNPNDALYVIIPVLAIVVIYFMIKLAKKEKIEN